MTTTTKRRSSVLAEGGIFALDMTSAHRLWESVERALDAWMQEHPGLTPAVWVSAVVHSQWFWLVQKHGQALRPPVRVYTDTGAQERDREGGVMADRTRIDWCDASWNPWGWGCYGPGGSAKQPKRCYYCYAERLARRKMNTCPQCQAFVPHWHPERLDEPLHLRKPSRIFCGSMSTRSRRGWTGQQLDAALEVIAACKQHTFYMLTKWPGNILRALYEVTEAWPVRELGGGDCIPNLWLGASVDTYARAAQTDIAMRQVAHAGWRTFVSIEPMLQFVNVADFYWADWLIVGAMTGAGAS